MPRVFGERIELGYHVEVWLFEDIWNELSISMVVSINCVVVTT
jgi:hypothetical protein